VRYRPYLVDSVWNYDATALVHKTLPEITADMSDGNEAVFKAVQDGMYELATTARSLMFAHLPDLPAYKTGTPEIIPNELYNSTVIGYYPFNNPKIAFAVVMEGGELSARAIRNIIDAYFYDHYEPVLNDNGIPRAFWEPWTEPLAPVPGRYND